MTVITVNFRQIQLYLGALRNYYISTAN